MNNTLDQLVRQVEEWSIDKNLHLGKPDRQALKFYEEAGEVVAALSRNNKDALKRWNRRYFSDINHISTTTRLDFKRVFTVRL